MWGKANVWANNIIPEALVPSGSADPPPIFKDAEKLKVKREK